MILKRIKLKNCCQHADREFEFTSGVNGIVGSNRSGKSNLMKAAHFALTGNWPGGDAKSRKITRGETEGYVELEFTIHGHTGIVKRYLHSSKCSLRYANKDFKRSTEVDEQLSQILEANSKVLSNYVFIHQDETTRVLFEQPAKRMALFGILFGTDKCEAIRNLLQTEMQTHVPATLSADADRLPQQIFDLEAKLAGFREQLQELQQRIGAQSSSTLQDSITELRSRARRFNDPISGYDALRSSCSNLQERIGKSSEQLKSVAIRLSEADKTARELESTVVEHRAVLATRDQALAEERKRQAIFKQLEDLESEVSKYPKPVEVENKDTVWQLAEVHLEQQEAELKKSRDIIAGFSKGNCPTCNTTAIMDLTGKFVDIPSLLQKHKNFIESNEAHVVAERAEYEQYKRTRQKYLLDKSVWETWHSGFQSRMNSLIQIIEGMGDPIQIPDVSESANVVQQYESAKQTLATLQNTQKQLEIELIQLQSELNSSTTQLQELENLKPIQDPAPLEAQLIQLTNDLTLEANLSGRIQEAETHLADLHKRRIHIEELKAQSSGLNKYRELLSNAYGLLHRDHYPSVVARYFIDSLNQHWNEILASLDVKFAVEIQEDMSVKVINSDGDGFIEELSGGEKCCASIAFLMAVNRQFASKVGFLVLDEPTYGLDDDHLDRLRDLVLDVQGYASANGLQIIMVTHERSLKDSFHNVVEV